jgi:Ankyrin repeats (many copies)
MAQSDVSPDQGPQESAFDRMIIFGVQGPQEAGQAAAGFSPDVASAQPPNSVLRLTGAAYIGNLERVREALASGFSVDAADPDTGLTALHIAAGTNNLALCRMLVEEYGAPFGPDKFGR